MIFCFSNCEASFETFNALVDTQLPQPKITKCRAEANRRANRRKIWLLGKRPPRSAGWRLSSMTWRSLPNQRGYLPVIGLEHAHSLTIDFDHVDVVAATGC